MDAMLETIDVPAPERPSSPIKPIHGYAVAGCLAVWFLPATLPVDPLLGEDIQRVVLFLAALATVLTTAIAARITVRRERMAWLMVLSGVLLMLLGDLASTSVSGAPRQPLSLATSFPALLWFASYLPYLLAYTMFMESSRDRLIERARRIVELVLLVSLVTLTLYVTVLFPIYGRTPDDSLVSTLLFFASLSVSFSLLLYLAMTRPRLSPWHSPLVWSLITVSLGSLIDALTAITGMGLGLFTPVNGLPWFMGYALVGIAGVERIRFASDTPRNLSIVLHKPSPLWGTSLSALTFAGLPVFVYYDSIWSGDALGDVSFSLLISVAAVVAIGRNLAIAAENSSLRRHATTDPLTGLYNHRHFHERLAVEVGRAGRSGHPLSVVAIDVDDFDRVNNVYGHSAGDARLRSIAERLAAASRSTDILCRVGGDEFSIVMPDTDPIDAFKVCLRLQDFLHEPDDVCPLPISLSIGIANLPEHADNAEDLVQRADGALYWAKFHGREQIVIYDDTLVRSLGPEERIARLEEESYVNMVQLLSSAVDARDPYTHHHSRRVAELTVALAREIGIDEEGVATLETAALLHDVGKIGVPDAVLRKPDVLTAHERELVNEHPLLGARILGAIPRQEILPWIASHHERWDGAGYPAGLSGDDIPLQARIIALCDSFDAMTSDRPYRPGLGLQEACAEIAACAGGQFDPDLAPRFIDVLQARQAAGLEGGPAALREEA